MWLVQNHLMSFHSEEGFEPMSSRNCSEALIITPCYLSLGLLLNSSNKSHIVESCKVVRSQPEVGFRGRIANF